VTILLDNITFCNLKNVFLDFVPGCCTLRRDAAEICHSCKSLCAAEMQQISLQQRCSRSLHAAEMQRDALQKGINSREPQRKVKCWYQRDATKFLREMRSNPMNLVIPAFHSADENI
jgi:hypothetical protein